MKSFFFSILKVDSFAFLKKKSNIIQIFLIDVIILYYKFLFKYQSYIYYIIPKKVVP